MIKKILKEISEEISKEIYEAQINGHANHTIVAVGIVGFILVTTFIFSFLFLLDKMFKMWG